MTFSVLACVVHGVCCIQHGRPMLSKSLVDGSEIIISLQQLLDASIIKHGNGDNLGVQFHAVVNGGASIELT